MQKPNSDLPSVLDNKSGIGGQMGCMYRIKNNNYVDLVL